MITRFVLLLLFLMSVKFCLSQSDHEIIYNFPESVDSLILIELNRGSNDDFDTLNYLTFIILFEDTGGVYSAFISAIGKNDVENNRLSKTIRPLVLLTNRYLVIEGLKIPIIFASDLIFTKYAVSPNGSTYNVKFNINGEILGHGR